MRTMTENKDGITEINSTLTKNSVELVNRALMEMAADTDSSRESKHWEKRSVYRLPSSVTDLNTKAYSPQRVSIGPYHCGKEHLRAMDEHKLRALRQFLNRSGKPVDHYLNALVQVVEDLRDAYDRLDDFCKKNIDEFLVMMLVDGCFILELMRTTVSNWLGYAPNDPIFSSHGMLYVVPYLKRDMLMLENQLPMLVLTTLFTAENDTLIDADLVAQRKVCWFILKFFSQAQDYDSDIHDKIEQFSKCVHILDVYRNSLVWRVSSREIKTTRGRHRGQYQQPDDFFIPSATGLDEAGIRITKSRTRSLTDISFHGGVLRLPLIVVDDTFEFVLLNLMAFEHFHVGAGNEVTSYIFFMSSMVDNARDVRLLNSCGVIQNALGSDQAVANLFNSLSKDITLDPHSSIGDVYQQIAAYCQNLWRLWRAELIRNYFPSRRVELSVYLFILTVVQTVFGVLSYRPK